MVGAVVMATDAAGPRIVGEGWHERFGGPHAEVRALVEAGNAARGATLYVTLEPCCHSGKTPPCTEAILAAGIARVVVAAGDPFPAVAGRGIAQLRAAGVVVEEGLLTEEAVRLTAPFRKLVQTGRPWVIAKWAMSLDGRLATQPGDDRWISSPESRELVHDLRRRVDAILVGIGTVLADDPSLTARPAGARRGPRIVCDGLARTPPDGRLVRSAREWPVLIAVGPRADRDRVSALAAAGCEIWDGPDDPQERFAALLDELGRRRVTNLLVEGGPTLLERLFANDLVDEVWAFVAPKIIGGATAPFAVAPRLDAEEVSLPGGDILVRGLVRPTSDRG